MVAVTHTAPPPATGEPFAAGGPCQRTASAPLAHLQDQAAGGERGRHRPQVEVGRVVGLPGDRREEPDPPQVRRERRHRVAVVAGCGDHAVSDAGEKRPARPDHRPGRCLDAAVSAVRDQVGDGGPAARGWHGDHAAGVAAAIARMPAAGDIEAAVARRERAALLVVAGPAVRGGNPPAVAGGTRRSPGGRPAAGRARNPAWPDRRGRRATALAQASASGRSPAEQACS